MICVCNMHCTATFLLYRFNGAHSAHKLSVTAAKHRMMCIFHMCRICQVFQQDILTIWPFTHEPAAFKTSLGMQCGKNRAH